MKTFLQWTFHWCFQGLKLVLFALASWLVAFPTLLPLNILEEVTPPFHELSTLGKVGMTTAYVGSAGFAIAVFTAFLAAQLKHHPLHSLPERATENGVHRHKPLADESDLTGETSG